MTVFRIPGKTGAAKAKNPPAFFQHGLFDSADGWVARDSDSPAFVMVDAGYDVWLGNSRGNKYSLEHATLVSDSKEYWQFGWEE